MDLVNVRLYTLRSVASLRAAPPPPSPLHLKYFSECRNPMKNSGGGGKLSVDRVLRLRFVESSNCSALLVHVMTSKGEKKYNLCIIFISDYYT